MWDNDKIEKLLLEHEDEAYREFQGGLTKTSYSRIGVRVPVLRKIAKEIVKSDEWEEFLSVRPIVFYEHAMLAGIISATVKEPYEEKIKSIFRGYRRLGCLRHNVFIAEMQGRQAACRHVRFCRKRGYMACPHGDSRFARKFCIRRIS